MGFRELFKVRKPGNGDKVQKALMSKKSGPKIGNKGMVVPNAGIKKAI
jgi:hypothetical protein